MDKLDLFNKEDLQLLSDKLVAVREMKGLNRKQAASAAGVSYEWLSKLETQKHTEATPTRKTLLKYCKFLGISVQLSYQLKFA